VASLDFNNLFRAEIFIVLGEILESTFNKGGRRVFDTKGEPIEVDFNSVKNRDAVQALLTSQRSYFVNLTEDIRDKIFEELQVSLEKGEGIPQATKRVMKAAEGLSKHRAQTIARSEIIKASSLGTQNSLEAAGIEEAFYLPTPGNDNGFDKKVAEVCRQNHTGKQRGPYKFGEYQPYPVRSVPIPVRDSHPNCRCTIIGNI